MPRQARYDGKDEVIIIKDEPTSPNRVDDDGICELEHLRKLFIGGLAPYTTEENLKEFYNQWGNVVDVVVMRDTATKRSRGFGFITYTRASMVDKAQENRPHIIDGKVVEAKRALPRPERENRETNISVKKLFVGGLKDNHNEECLQEYFEQFGKVISVKILTDKTTGKRRGFAFVEFDDYDAVDKATLQKAHSIKYVVVDVKKSVYNHQQQQQQQQGHQHQQNNQTNQSKLNKPMRGFVNGPHPSGGLPPTGPPHQGNPFQQHPQMPPPQHPPPHIGPVPPNFNNWGPPPPQYGGYQQPPPPQNWNYPPVPNAWNAGPTPPPVGPPNWPQNQWGYPQHPPPPSNCPQPPPGSWNGPPINVPAIPPPGIGPPGIAPPGVTNVAPPQHPQQPPPNFGTGYQQNYGGGPTKHNNMTGVNRMNPYNGPSNNNYGNKAPPPVAAYGGYKGGPPFKPPAVQTNGNAVGTSNSKNSFRR